MSNLKNTKYFKNSFAASVPPIPNDMGPPVALAPPPGLGEGKGGGKRPAKSQDWVTDLQKKLIAKAAELGVTIDLGRSGAEGNGVDGVYGNKTREAVNVIAQKLNISRPFAANGTPTEEFKTALGAPAPGAQSPQEAVKDVAPARDMITVPVDGTEFSMAALIGALPPDMTKKIEGGKVVSLSGAEALKRFRMIRTGIETGGLPAGNPLPKMYGLPAPEMYDEVADKVKEIYDILVSSLKKLDTAVKAEIARKRAEMKLPPEISSGATQEAYKGERALSAFPQAIIQGLTYAYIGLDDYLRQMSGSDKTNPQSLLDVMKRNTTVASSQASPSSEWTEDQAAEVGRVLMSGGGWIGKRILPEDPSKFYQGTKDSSFVDKQWPIEFKKNSAAIWKILGVRE